MKHTLLIIMCAMFVRGGFAADWTYDSGAGTISDGDWTFAATVKNGTDMTVGACSAYPGTASLLDFSKPVSDGATDYDIVAFDTGFGVTDNSYGQNMATTPAGLAVSALRLPDNGKLTTIKTKAFARMDNCTSVEPLIPDSVTELEIGAFWGLKAEQAVRLYGIGTLRYTVFYSSKVGSVTFGPNLKALYAAWNSGPFNQCKSLTNVTFDVNMSGGYFAGCVNGGTFEGCSALTGTLDLSGFSRFNYWAFTGTQFDTVVLGTNLTELASSAFNGMTKLTTVKFYGAPPATLGTPVFGSLSASQIIATYVMSEDPDVQAAWAAKTAGGVLNKESSTWHQDYVVSGSVPNRYLVLPSGGSGELGDWIYDDSAKTLTRSDNKWVFSASKSFHQVMIGSCTIWPTEVDELDFGGRITDTDGVELTLYEINTAFAYGGNGEWAYFDNGNPTITTGAQYVGRLVLPAEGLQRICRGAFAGCTALTNVVNYIPDSVTYLGVGAFFKVPAAQDVRLYGVPRVDYLAFGNSGITSVTFGPNLSFLEGFYSNATFNNCTSLTNVWFDPGMSGATISSSSTGVFGGCSKLKGRLDLRGFSTLGSDLNLSSTKVEEIVIGDAVTSLPAGYFTSSYITNVIFTGRPPVSLGTPFLSGRSSTKVITATVYKDYLREKNSAGKCWLDYSAHHAIYPTRTTWATNYVANGINLVYRPLICPDAPHPGLRISVR